MKLQELDSNTQVQKSHKVFKQHFGKSIQFEAFDRDQVDYMLRRVRSLIREHRNTKEFHHSEKNPAYLKLVIVEQALTARLKEVAAADANNQASPMNGDLARGVAKVAAATGQGGQTQRLTKAIQSTMAGKTLDSASKAALAQHMTGIAALEKDPNMAGRLQQMLRQASAQSAVKETRRTRKLREASEIQQAQVVLAAQDMVDRVQKMIEDVSAMQFKDLPALVDSIRNEVGMDQAQKFNADATAALSGLVQGLQGSKVQLETAQGALTGQAPVVPGQPDMMGAEPGLDQTAPMTDVDVDAEIDVDADQTDMTKPLGRERR